MPLSPGYLISFLLTRAPSGQQIRLNSLIFNELVTPQNQQSCFISHFCNCPLPIKQVLLSLPANQQYSCPLIISFTINLPRLRHNSLFRGLLQQLLIGNPVSTYKYLKSILLYSSLFDFKNDQTLSFLLMTSSRTTMNIGTVQDKIINGGKYTIYWNLPKYFSYI